MMLIGLQKSSGQVQDYVGTSTEFTSRKRGRNIKHQLIQCPVSISV